MTAKTLSALVILTAVLIIATLVINRSDEQGPTQQGQKVFPALMGQVNELTEIVVATPKKSVVVQRAADAWTVKDKYGYRADLGKVRQTILGLAELTLVEAKTQNPELYEKLGLRDIDKEGSRGTKISLKTADDKVVAELIIGNRRPAKGNPGKDEVFIRRQGESQTWMALGSPLVESIPEEWLDKTILDLEPKRINRVQILHPNRSTLTLVKRQPEDADYSIVGLPAQAKIKSQFMVNNIVSSLANLSLEDVKPQTEETVDEKRAVKAIVETRDGLQATVLLEKRADKILAAVSSRFDSNLIQTVQESSPEAKAKPEEKKGDDTQPAESKTQEKGTDKSEDKSPEEVRAEVDLLNKKTTGWVYIIPQFRADYVIKTMDDLIEKQSGT